MIRFRRRLPPTHRHPLRILHAHELLIDCRRKTAALDGVRQRIKLGSWMFYLPKLQAKLFYAANGRTDCIHSSRPPDYVLNDPRSILENRYTTDDWRRALATPLARRLAEIWLVSARLWQAGLGPQPLGVCFVEHFVRDARALGPTCGLLSENVFRMPRKLPGLSSQLRQAGVVPDRLGSCLRQQVRGYVIDLCSVVGCVPTHAEETVLQLERLFREIPPGDEWRPVLEETLRLA
ncbi:MAG: hypothetical protein K9N49_00400 [Candidatus Marinimicrobia bacterium]|nr:hypothetical protein [Candidatus Neomarinimicrobiota bacterium]